MANQFAGERWMPVKGFPYEVSSLGSVRSLPRALSTTGRSPKSIKGRILKGRPNRRGHLRVQLHGDGMMEEFLVSRLVATYFVPNPDCLPFVRHKDFDRANNAATNLEWCTNSENIERALAGGRFTALVSPTRAKTLDAEIAEAAYFMRCAGLTFAEISGALNIGVEAAMNVCHGKAWQHESRPSLARRNRSSLGDGTMRELAQRGLSSNPDRWNHADE